MRPLPLRPVSLLLLLTAACSPPDRGTESSSSSGGSASSSAPSSSGTASSSGGVDGGPPAQTIELGALCRELRAGYRRSVLRTLNRCGAAFVDSDLERADMSLWEPPVAASLGTAQQQLAAAVCDQFGNLRMYLDHVTQSIDRGRVTYDGTAAYKCREASSQPVLARRDLPPAQADSFRLEGTALPAVCNEVFRGLLDPGDPCALTHECRPGHYCRPLRDDTSDGECAVQVALGDACDSRDECAGGGLCLDATCHAPLEDGDTCVDAEGYALPCGTGLVCASGVCKAFGEEGQGCSETGVPCAPGLVCTGSATSPSLRKCQLPAAAGDSCALDSQCGDCLRCGASGSCERYLRVGEACDKDHDGCGPALRCSDASQCEMRPREGQPCRVPLAGGSQVGDCLDTDTFCARESREARTGVCQPLPRAEGEPCGNAPDRGFVCLASTVQLVCSDPDRGHCRGPARLGEPCRPTASPPLYCDHGFCLQADGGPEGVCTSLPNIGDPCGSAPGLAPSCQTGFCRYAAGSSVGECAAIPDIGQPCGTAADLASYCVFGVCVVESGESQGVCAYPLPAGASCTSSAACESGTCDPHIHRCITPGQSCQGCSHFEPVLFLLSLGMVHFRLRAWRRRPAR